LSRQNSLKFVSNVSFGFIPEAFRYKTIGIRLSQVDSSKTPPKYPFSWNCGEGIARKRGKENASGFSSFFVSFQYSLDEEVMGKIQILEKKATPPCFRDFKPLYS